MIPALVIFGAVAAVTHAQTASSLGLVTVNIKADVWWQNWTCDSSLSLSIDSANGTRTAAAYVCDPADQSLIFNSETNQILARLVPGRVYTVNANAWGTAGFAVHAIPEPGYTLEMEGVPTQQVSVAMDGWYNIRLYVRPPDEGGTGLRGGMATALGNERVLWQLSLGSLSNGESAGSLTFLDVNYLPVSSAFKASQIDYDPASSEVWVRRNPAGVAAPNVAGAIRQILAPQVCVDVVQSSDTVLQMKVYHRAQLGAESGGFFSFSGDPFAWYFIQREGSDPNAVKIECQLRDLATPTSAGQPIVRTNVTRLQRSGTAPNHTWTATDWHQDGQGAVAERVRMRAGTTETFTVATPGQSPVSQGSRVLANKPWGEEVQNETLGTNNASTTNYDYWETVGEDSAAYARLRSKITTGGAWEAYEYYDYADGEGLAGQIRRRHEPFNNSSTSVPSDLASHTGEVTEFSYANDPFGRATWPTLVETKVNGVTVAKTEIAYDSAIFYYAWNTALYLVTTTRKEYADANSFLTTVTKYFREDAGTQPGCESDDFFRRRVHSVTRSDGLKQVYAYQRGTWNGSGFTASPSGGLDPSSTFASRTVVIAGTAATGTAYANFEGYPIDEVRLAANKSTMQATINDAYGRLVRTERYVYDGTGWQLISAVNNAWNFSNQLVKRASNLSATYDLNSGAIYEATHTGDHVVSDTDEAGVNVTYTYDAAGRLDTTTKTGVGAIGALTTKLVYDAAGRTLEQRVGWGQTEQIVTSKTYDLAGRVLTESAPGPNGAPVVTSYGYDPAARRVTVTLPNGGTRIETQFADGHLQHLTGSAVVPQYFTYQVQSGGVRYGRINLGTETGSRFSETWTDWLGRATQSSRPGFTGQPVFVEQTTFEPNTGRPQKIARTGSASSLYTYDAFSQPWRAGLDLDGNDTLAVETSDRVTETEQYFENTAGAWWLTRVERSYPRANNGTPFLLSTTRERLTGHVGNLRSEIVTTDADGNTTTKTVSVDRGNKTITLTTTATGMANAQTEIQLNGLVVSATRFDGLSSATTYDALHRQSTTSDPRTGTMTTFYKPGTTFVHGIWGRIDAAGSYGYLTTHTYDAAGRVIAEANATGKVTRTEYNLRDQIVRRWGDTTYPVEYGYNNLGERVTMKTYRGGSGWDGATWPSNAGAADWTRWVFDEPTGLLKEKYDAANLDSAGTPITGAKKISFTYNARGQTATRTRARGTTTTYGYHALTGELLTIGHSDGTPGTTYTYTRAGQIDTVTDATGQRSFVYNSTNPLLLDAVALGTFYGNRIFTRQYDGYKRPNGFYLGAAGNLAGELTQTQTYNTLGRFESVTSASSAQAARTFSYGYNGGGLVSGLGVGGSPFAVSYGHEPHRNLLVTINATWSGTVRARYDYTYNALAQRTTAKQSGEVFWDFDGSTYYRYAYNDRGEVTEAVDYAGEDPTSTAAPQLAGRRFGYAYDHLGNRSSATRALGTGVSDAFVANSLNQYTSRENDVAYTAGTAQAASAIAVSGGTSTAAIGRTGRYWGAELTLNNVNGPAKADLTVTATLAGSPTLVHTAQRTIYLAKALQVFSYDDDGNLSGDGVWNYAYDAENRLVQMTTTGVAVSAGFPSRTLEFKYDYLGRRVQKRSVNSTTGSDTYRRYLYDNWDLVAEYSATSSICGSLVRSYTWGLDITGSLTATGGIGALVQLTDHATSTSYFPTYDGNGNLMSLLRANDGVVAAKYEYSPFGELLRCEGSYAKENPFRFSTKFADDESGLSYYGHRYYSASLGRFVNRDPIDETGGLNLYGFPGNDPLNGHDVLGMGFFSKLWKGVKSFWNKFRHTIISAVLYAIPGVGPVLSTIYNTAVGARYGGVKGALLALAGGGRLGSQLQVAANAYGLYQTFGHGKFLNNFGNWYLNAMVANTSYQLGNAMFGDGSTFPSATPAENEAPIDSSHLGEKLGTFGSRRELNEFVTTIGNLDKYESNFFAALREGKAWSLYRTDGIHTNLVYANGILGLVGRHASLGVAHLSSRFSNVKQFTIAHNRSHRFYMDILEAGGDLLGIPSKSSRLLADALETRLKSGAATTLVAHSQGFATTIKAMRILALKGVEASGLTIYPHAGAANSFHTAAVANGLGAKLMPHVFSSRDLVPGLVGMNANPVQGLLGLVHFPKLFGAEDDSPHTLPNNNPKLPWFAWGPGN